MSVSLCLVVVCPLLCPVLSSGRTGPELVFHNLHEPASLQHALSPHRAQIQTTMPLQRRQSFSDEFGLLDKDGDGVITAEELGFALRARSPEVSAEAASTWANGVLRLHDRDGSGKLDRVEFAAFMNGRHEKLRAAFDQLDHSHTVCSHLGAERFCGTLMPRVFLLVLCWQGLMLSATCCMLCVRAASRRKICDGA